MAKISKQILDLSEKIIKFLESTSKPREIHSFHDLHLKLLHFFLTDLFLTGNQVFGSYNLNLIHNYLIKISETCSNSSNLSLKMTQIRIRCLIDKLKLLVKCLPYSYSLKEDDLECLDESHPRKQAIKAITRIRNFNVEEVRTQTAKFLVKYEALKAAFMKTCEFKKSRFRDLMTVALLVYYQVNKEAREREVELYNVKAKIDTMKMIWDLTESALMRKIYPIIFPRIKFNRLIFIPRTCEKVNKIEKVADIDQIKSFKYSSTAINDYVGVRVLSHSKKTFTPQKKYQTLIIHIHGGGFIGQSTFTHQTYLRKWANELKLPIFSIDYRLAPDHKFPEGLDDAWQAYVWLVVNSEDQLGIRPDKILLIGDSAGGNFIASVCMKAKEIGFKQPDALLFIYPGLNMSVEYVSSGALSSLEDPLLTYSTFFEVCSHYVDDPEELKSYLVSPILCPDNLLKNFPKSRFMLSCKDPLLSDSLRLVDRLLRQSADVGVLQYPEYVHGALNLSTPSGIPIFQNFVNDALSEIKDLII